MAGGAALPQLCPRSSEQRGHSLTCPPQPPPLSPSLGSPGCPNLPSCRLWEQLGHLRASCPGEPCQGSVPSLCMLQKALCPLWGQHGQRRSSFWGKQFQGHRWYKQNEAEKLNKNQTDTDEPQPDLQAIPQRIQVWPLGYTEKWLKGDSKIRPSSFCSKERHSKRYMR